MPERTCSVAGCERKHRSLGFCNAHYQRWLKHGDLMDRAPIKELPPPGSTCSEPGCDRKLYAREMCRPHYMKFRSETGAGGRLCSVPGCGRPEQSLGFCRTHYSRHRRFGHAVDLTPDSCMCGIGGCPRARVLRGYCREHADELRPPDGFLRCSDCLSVKSETDFYRRPTPDGRDAACKPCRRRYQRPVTERWRQEHPESQDQWRRNNPDKVAVLSAKRQARRRKNDVRLVTLRDWERLCRRYDHCCAYCGEKRPLTQDHVIPVSRGGRHSIGNLLPACKPCNSSKNARLLAEWIRERLLA